MSEIFRRTSQKVRHGPRTSEDITRSTTNTTSSSIPTLSTTTTTNSSNEHSSSSSSRPSFPHGLTVPHVRHSRSASMDTHSRRSFFRSRSKSPAPIDTRGRSPSPVPSSQRHGGQRTSSPGSYSPESPSSPGSPTTAGGSSGRGSGSSAKARKRYSAPAPRKSSSDYKRYSGTVNHYGRHGNDWLFGGFSVRESVGKLLRDHDHDHDHGGGE